MGPNLVDVVQCDLDIKDTCGTQPDHADVDKWLNS